MPDASGAIELHTIDLVLAAALILISGLVSIFLKLSLEKQLFIASARTVIQLLMVGYVLKFVFNLDSLISVFLIAIIMIGAASRAAIKRSSRSYKGATMHSFITLVFSGIITSYIVTGVIIDVQPWYKPQYIIPLLGMILGNGLTGISLALDQLLDSFYNSQDEIEMELAHGASSWEAARTPVANAVRKGMIPIINSMMVVGLVSLPGMMTGQILEGADPLLAVKYQIVVMFMIASATSIGCIMLTLLAYRSLFNEKHQLLVEKIIKNS